MKVKGNGQGKVLTAPELKRLFKSGFLGDRDRCLFAICLFTGCRISEALALQVTDIKNKTITFRKSTTKGKLKTRTIDIPVTLLGYLEEYQPLPNPYNPYLFPSRAGKPLTRSMADKLLRAACSRIGVEGVSTHSFRRTALTQMHNAGIPLRHIQEISGHNDLGTLQRYLEVSPEQRKKAVSVIGW
ncbi:MAG: tyrosine-type recombinase/integrase [Xenococcus sp. (in: cyanobacteria)]